jgi:hypothetical protein
VGIINRVCRHNRIAGIIARIQKAAVAIAAIAIPIIIAVIVIVITATVESETQAEAPAMMARIVMAIAMITEPRAAEISAMMIAPVIATPSEVTQE